MLPIKRAASSLYQPIPPQGQAAGAGALRPSLTRDLLGGAVVDPVRPADPVSLAEAHLGQLCLGVITERRLERRACYGGQQSTDDNVNSQMVQRSLL